MLLRLILFSFLAVSAFAEKADPIDLSRYEKSLYSENGEDGVLAEIFTLLGPGRRYCVEFNAYDGINRSNTYLLRKQGWTCLRFDRSNEYLEEDFHMEFINAKNVNKVFSKYLIPFSFELLSIHVDYNDFHVWKALSPEYRPYVVVIQYNGSHPPSADKVVKYHSYSCGYGSNYFGASILALFHLGRAKGYSLVYAEKAGRSLFFIRDDILQKRHLSFKDMNDVEKLYHFHNGYRPDPLHRAYLSSSELIEK